jgi:hypothetical protein
MKDILSTIATFGSVSVETSPPSVVIKSRKAKQAQLMFAMQHSSAKSINDDIKTLGNPPSSLPLSQWLYYLGRFVDLMHTL